jgi:putative transposase
LDTLATVCQTLAFPRSSFYCQALALNEQELENAIDELAAAWPTDGYRRITAMLQRHGQRVNRKRVLRIMRQKRLLRTRKAQKRRPINSRHALSTLSEFGRKTCCGASRSSLGS